jgi:hypothetical protein
MINYLSTHYVSWLQGGFGYGIISYMVRTFPVPNNEYLKWFVSGIQYAFAQFDKAQNCYQQTNYALNRKVARTLHLNYHL